MEKDIYAMRLYRENKMKYLLSELGQCIIFGVIFLFIIVGFNDVLTSVTGG